MCYILIRFGILPPESFVALLVHTLMLWGLRHFHKTTGLSAQAVMMELSEWVLALCTTILLPSLANFLKYLIWSSVLEYTWQCNIFFSFCRYGICVMVTKNLLFAVNMMLGLPTVGFQATVTCWYLSATI